MSNLKGLKKIFARKKIGEFRSKRQPLLKKISEYSELLIIGDANNQQLMNEAQVFFRTAKITLLSPRMKKEADDTFDNYTYHNSDLNLTGKIKSEKLIKLCNKEFDLVLDLSTYTELNAVILEKLKHTFCVGKASDKKASLYDLILSTGSNSAEFFNAAATQITSLSKYEN